MARLYIHPNAPAKMTGITTLMANSDPVMRVCVQGGQTKQVNATTKNGISTVLEKIASDLASREA